MYCVASYAAHSVDGLVVQAGKRSERYERSASRSRSPPPSPPSPGALKAKAANRAAARAGLAGEMLMLDRNVNMVVLQSKATDAARLPSTKLL